MRRIDAGAGRQAGTLGSLTALMLIITVLAGCAAPKPRPENSISLHAQQAREMLLEEWQEWGFSGRISVSGGGESGSGRIDWRRSGSRLEVLMQAPVSRRSWRLVEDSGGASLEGLEGGTRHGESAEILLRDELGWELPVAQVEAWVRGSRSSRSAALEFDSDGLPQRMRDGAWEIEYRGWSTGWVALPQRVFAQSGSDKFRLVVDRWQQPER